MRVVVSLNLPRNKARMEKTTRRVKKVAKKSLLYTGKQTGHAEKKAPANPIDYTAILREGGEVADYEPDDAASFSPAEDVVSEPEDRPSTPVPGRGDSSSP